MLGTPRTKCCDVVLTALDKGVAMDVVSKVVLVFFYF